MCVNKQLSDNNAHGCIFFRFQNISLNAVAIKKWKDRKNNRIYQIIMERGGGYLGQLLALKISKDIE